MINKKKKSRRQRGSRTHGWGEGKKHRGAGHRGGRGNAGQGKRGSQKKTKYLAKGIKPIGKRGMRTLRGPKPINTINLSQISDSLDRWIKTGKVKKDKGMSIVNTKDLGYTKVLGRGKLKDKIKILAQSASKRAVEKVKAVGGDLEIISKTGE